MMKFDIVILDIILQPSNIILFVLGVHNLVARAFPVSRTSSSREQFDGRILWRHSSAPGHNVS